MIFTLLWHVGSVLDLPLAGFIKKLKARYLLFTHHQQENWSSTMLGSASLYPKFIHSFNALHDIVRGRSFMVWPMAQRNTRRGWVSKRILRMLYLCILFHFIISRSENKKISRVIASVHPNQNISDHITPSYLLIWVLSLSSSVTSSYWLWGFSCQAGAWKRMWLLSATSKISHIPPTWSEEGAWDLMSARRLTP